MNVSYPESAADVGLGMPLVPICPPVPASPLLMHLRAGCRRRCPLLPDSSTSLCRLIRVQGLFLFVFKANVPGTCTEMSQPEFAWGPHVRQTVAVVAPVP